MLEETVAAPERSDDELMGLLDALEGLPKRQRRAILLREWRGLSYREVARELDVTQASVEMLIFRARRSLAAALEQGRATPGRRSLHVLDLGSLLAAIKGFFAGSAGVKAVATLAVATATTATVAATDPAGVWSEPHSRSAANARATQPAVRPATSGSTSDRPVLPEGRTRGRVPSTHEPAGPRLGRGRAFGQATAAAAKDKAKGSAKTKEKGEAKAVGRAEPTSSSGSGVPKSGKPDRAGQTGPPPHAKVGGAAKQKSAKKSA